MSPEPISRAGFARPNRYRRARRQRSAMMAQLIATAALVISIAVAATAVSIGIARADGLVPVDDTGARVAVATLIALVIAGMGGFTAAAARSRLRARRRD